ncbi:BMC domain-containing protein [Halodesulfovibrio aestuarii]|uniref:BMC domain-containing protein n=1 Tax=Halodesulfovibrio aestuarii TaxID=126333 RepID=A0A8G2CA06_9BACT|nr:BMC domain-containing protein [Halodesulfovibrio aestuarii]SHJ24345.1 BMC domain-containing protein [Halodesulfovibrio aestuarii]
MSALGLIETRGLISAIEGADAMVKSSNVRLMNKTYVGAGLVTITVTGDVAAVKSSVDAALAAISRLHGGEVISSHVIPRPESGITDVLFDTPKDSSGSGQAEGYACEGGQSFESCFENEMKSVSAIDQPEHEDVLLASPAVEDAEPAQNAEKNLHQLDNDSVSSKENGTIPSSENENLTVSKKKKALPISKDEVDALNDELGTQQAVAMLAQHTVATLRVLARQYSEFTIDKKKLSKVKKRALLEGFTRYYNLLNS